MYNIICEIREVRKHRRRLLVVVSSARDSIFVPSDESVLSRINQEEQMFAVRRGAPTSGSQSVGHDTSLRVVGNHNRPGN